MVRILITDQNITFLSYCEFLIMSVSSESLVQTFYDRFTVAVNFVVQIYTIYTGLSNNGLCDEYLYHHLSIDDFNSQ